MTYRGLGFGEPVSKAIPYSIALSPVEFSQAVHIAFDEFVADCKMDDEQTESQDAIQAIVDNQYGTFREFLNRCPNDLCWIVCEYLFLELLEGLFNTTRPTQARFVINSIDQIRFENNTFVITGSVYRTGVLIYADAFKLIY